jgi:hypothetical protein
MSECEMHSSGCTAIRPLLEASFHQGRAMQIPLRISPDLTVRLGDGRSAVRLTPAQAMRAAELLIRRGTRMMMIEEAVKPPRPARRVSRSVN